MKDFQEHCSVRDDAIENSVKKAERDIAVLHGQLQSNRQVVHDLLEQLDSTQEVAYSSDAHLTEVEKVIDALWDLLKDVRETLHALSMRRERLDQSPFLASSGEQLLSIATLNSHLTLYSRTHLSRPFSPRGS